ncbi:hypothetical protein MKW98_024397 [Papaver atlanticum]|uniref:Uncharacterized protein n=1 Tax=Papaver atlanticum TaxID=357466 RepID=A0AAD4T095_9MAGN|nr:hypothetical protein MKW98_024397 [Papaver atlanticum]
MATIAVDTYQPETTRKDAICKTGAGLAEGLKRYYEQNIHVPVPLEQKKINVLNWLEAQRNDLNSEVSMQGEELQLHQEAGSYIDEVVKAEKVPDSADDMILKQQLRELRELIELPLRHPELFGCRNTAPPKAIELPLMHPELFMRHSSTEGKTLLERLAFAYPIDQHTDFASIRASALSAVLLDEIGLYSEPIITKHRAPRRTKYRINSKSRSLHR